MHWLMFIAGFMLGGSIGVIFMGLIIGGKSGE